MNTPNFSRFEEIQRIIANEAKPFKEQDKTIRCLNDRDIDWLVHRIMQLEGTLKILVSVPRERLTGDNIKYLAKDGLKELAF